MKETTKKLVREIVEIGYENEATDYNGKFEGYKGFDRETRQRKLDTRNKRAKEIIDELAKEGIDPFDYDGEDFENEDFGGSSIVEDLEYAMQFIGMTYEEGSE